MVDLHFCRMHRAIWLCIRHKYVQWAKQYKAQEPELETQISSRLFLYFLLQASSSFATYGFRTCQTSNVFRVYSIYFTFISPKIYYTHIQRKRERKKARYSTNIETLLYIHVHLNLFSSLTIHCIFEVVCFEIATRHQIYENCDATRNDKGKKLTGNKRKKWILCYAMCISFSFSFYIYPIYVLHSKWTLLR